MDERLFTLAEARALMPEVHRHAEALVAVRADLTELTVALRAGVSSPLGGVAEAKALEARLHEELAWFTGQGLQVKGFAPLIVDFPAEYADEPVLLCWLEGEPRLGWYHRADVGFPGRRPLRH